MRNLLRTTLLMAACAMPASVFAQDKVTLNWALWDWASVAYYQPLIDAYQAKHPNVKIEYTDLGSQDYNTMLLTQLTGGATNLDVVTIKDIPGYANLLRSGALLNLSDNVAKAKIDVAAYGGLVEAITVDNGIYGLPFRSDFWLVYYNKDLFDAAGVAYPTNDMTLAQFDEKAKALTGGMGSNKVYGTYLHTWRSAVQLPGILDGKHTLIGGDYDFLKPYYERALGLQKAGTIPSYASLKTSSTHYSGPFYNKSVAMLPMGSWFIGTQIAKVKSGESLSTNWGLASFPHPDGVAAGTTAAQVTSLGVNAKSKHQEQALDFVNFVSGPEGAEIIAKTGTIPALRTDEVVKVITSKEGFPTDEGSRAAMHTVKSYLEMSVSLKAAEIEVVLNRAHDAIMTDSISIDDGIAQMNEDVQAILKK
jgi:multiple sugar transport system substrate-binding protein